MRHSVHVYIHEHSYRQGLHQSAHTHARSTWSRNPLPAVPTLPIKVVPPYLTSSITAMLGKSLSVLFCHSCWRTQSMSLDTRVIKLNCKSPEPAFTLVSFSVHSSILKMEATCRLSGHYVPQDSNLWTRLEAVSNSSTVAMRVVGYTKSEPSAWGDNRASLFLGDIKTRTCPLGLGESCIWDSKIRSWVPRDSHMRMG
jgi:hypothetical protein